MELDSVFNNLFLTRVKLRNYKSIPSCDVLLHPLTFLVGPNGSGKSNFLDALRLVADALNTSLDHALRERGGIGEVGRRSRGHPTHFEVRLEFRLRDGSEGTYAFRVGARPQGGFDVQHEECRVRTPVALQPEAFYRVESGEVRQTSLKIAPAAASDRLYLVHASGIPEFLPVYQALSHMGFYNLNPDRIRELQSSDAGDLLKRDGSNLSSVLRRIEQQSPESVERILEYLPQVVPGVIGVNVRQIGPKETIEFRQLVAGSPDPWRFLAANMSDGTLRALGVLVALFQSGGDSVNGSSAPVRVPLVGIEEPEAALHPGSAGVLRNSLSGASERIQILVTSHSPDLLDDYEVPEESLLAVTSEAGSTLIGLVDEAGRSAIRDRLYTAGELLRMNQLVPSVCPDLESAPHQTQLSLAAEDPVE